MDHIWYWPLFKRNFHYQLKSWDLGHYSLMHWASYRRVGGVDFVTFCCQRLFDKVEVFTMYSERELSQAVARD